MSLTTVEVYGINARKTEALPSGPRYVPNYQTQLPTKHRGKAAQSKRGTATTQKHFVLRLDEAEALEDRGDYGKAEAAYNDLVHFCKHEFGANRYETAIPYNHLALLHRHRGKLELAKALFEKSLKILILTQGENHHYTRIVRANLAALPTREHVDRRS
jgi:tetratricopeptide (TPR) repeat protein